jgi:hypothetical protein
VPAKSKVAAAAALGALFLTASEASARHAPQWEDSMRILICLAAAAATLTTVLLTLPAEAAHNRTHFRTHPYWQGEPTDRLPIWRYGYYQGNDPDQFIRSQMMRDPVYGPLR